MPCSPRLAPTRSSSAWTQTHNQETDKEMRQRGHTKTENKHRKRRQTQEEETNTETEDRLTDLKNRAGTAGIAGEHFGRLGNILDQNPRFFVEFLSLSEITYF